MRAFERKNKNRERNLKGIDTSKKIHEINPRNKRRKKEVYYD